MNVILPPGICGSHSYFWRPVPLSHFNTCILVINFFYSWVVVVVIFVVYSLVSGHWGGVFKAPRSYSFVSTDNRQTAVELITKFDNWDFSNNSIENKKQDAVGGGGPTHHLIGRLQGVVGHCNRWVYSHSWHPGNMYLTSVLISVFPLGRVPWQNRN